MIRSIKAQPTQPKFTTIRDFGGGLNVVDNDLNLDSRYATMLENMYRAQDGTMAIRYGTTLFTDAASVGFTDIVAIRYYNAALIIVDRTGIVGAVDGTGNIIVIFNNTIAASLPGTPLGWDMTDYAEMQEFNGVLAIVNGVNKPLVVYSDYSCEYMVDGSTGSNLYVPVARHITVLNGYLVLSGDPYNPTILYIGNFGTIGVFEGAPNPNNGVNIDIGPYVRVGNATIRGHRAFRNKLIIFFDDMIIIGQLGIFSGAVHTPTFDDGIEQVGAINPKTAVPIGDDIFFANIDTVSSLTRALFTGEVRPESASAFIDPIISYYLSRLNERGIRERVFSVFNPLEEQYMLFMPDDSNPEATSETICAVYTIARQSKDRPWSIFRGWNWECGCYSAAGRVFFAKGSTIFLYGTPNAAISGDFQDYEDTFSDRTAFDDGHGWDIPTDITTYEETETGVPVRFNWILPWADFDKRMINKFIKYVALDTNGSATYDLEMFTDNIVLDRSTLGEAFTDELYFSDGTGFIPQADLPYLPTVSMQLTSNDTSGYGAGGFGIAPYGGGRPTPYEHLYAWDAKFNIAKFRIHGESTYPLRVVSLSVYYNLGSIRR